MEDLLAEFRHTIEAAEVVVAMPGEVLNRPRKDHSLDQIAWQRVDRETPVNLECLIRDYLGHLKAHLEQILAKLV